MPKPVITPLDEMQIAPPDLGESGRYLAQEMKTMGKVLVANQMAIAKHLETLNGTVASCVIRANDHETRMCLLERDDREEAAREVDVEARIRQLESRSKPSSNDQAVTGLIGLTRLQTKQWLPVIVGIFLVLAAVGWLFSGGGVTPQDIIPLIP